MIQVAVDQDPNELLLRGYRKWLWLALATAAMVCLIAGYESHTAELGLFRRSPKLRSTPAQQASMPAWTRRLSSRTCSLGRDTECNARPITRVLPSPFAVFCRYTARARTPINNIRGQAEVVLTRARSVEEYRETITSSLEESVRLSELIESLLFLARADTPGIQLKREEIDVSAELAAVCEYYEAAAQEAQLALSVSSTEAVTAPLDRSLFQQAIMNLVANAIEHTPPGGSIALTSYRKRDRVCVAIADTGMEISSSDLSYVFDRLYRVDRARSNSGHVGLGLAIVKGIATVHGGSAEISSELGKGTRVVLAFPYD